MNKICLILLFIFSSCIYSGESTVEIKKETTNLDSILRIADSTMCIIQSEKIYVDELHLDIEDQNQQIHLHKMSEKELEKYFVDSIRKLFKLKLVNKDSIIYKYDTCITEIRDTLYLYDTIKKKKKFKLFKKKDK